MSTYPNLTVMECLLCARPQDRMGRGKKNLVWALKEPSGAYSVSKKTITQINVLKYTVTN